MLAPEYGSIVTTREIVGIIERAFGVRYHPKHVSRMIRAFGWKSIRLGAGYAFWERRAP